MRGQACLWASAIVGGQKRPKLPGSDLRRRIGADIGPLAEERLDEALRLAVRPRRVWPRGEMPEREGLPGRPKPARDIAAAVVTHAPANGHGAGGQRRHTAVEKGRAGVAPLVGQDLDIGTPSVVINSDMHILPAATTAHELTGGTGRPGTSCPPARKRSTRRYESASVRIETIG